MGIANRLAIGTANWGHRYGLSNVQVSEDEQKRILDYCQSIGIDMIDTATTYNWNWTEVDSSFKVVTKGNGYDEFPRKVYGYLAHGGIVWQSFVCRVLNRQAHKRGLSIYEPKEIPHFGTFGVTLAEIVQVPYSVYDRRFEHHFANLKSKDIEIHVRSIFLQGRILKETDLKPHECLAFCLMNPHVNRVIIGADSLEQLKQTVEPLLTLECYQKVDKSIIDPRRWKHD